MSKSGYLSIGGYSRAVTNFFKVVTFKGDSNLKLRRLPSTMFDAKVQLFWFNGDIFEIFGQKTRKDTW